MREFKEFERLGAAHTTPLPERHDGKSRREVERRRRWGKLAATIIALAALGFLGFRSEAVFGEARSAIPAPEPSASQVTPLTSVAASSTANAPIVTPSAAAAVTAAPAPASSDAKIILNVASETDLQRLPGVGPARAHAIIDLRNRLGRFRRVEELLKLKGIGRRTLTRLRPLIVIDPP